MNGFEWQPADGYARTYGVANVLNQATSQAGVGIGWDANGNMTSDGVNTYGWTVGSRLASVTRPGMSAFYHYDSEDRRTLKTVDGVMTRTLWSGTEPIAQYDTYGTLLRLIVPDGSGAMDTQTDGCVRLACVSRSNGTSRAWTYEPGGDLFSATDRVATRTLWSGTEPVAQYDTHGALLRLIIPDGSGAGGHGKGPHAQGQATSGQGGVRWQSCHRDRKGGDKR